MKKLEEFELLKKDVFYRGYHILEWIKLHPKMTELQKEIISASIIQALISKEEIDKTDLLDLNNLAIVNSVVNKEDLYRYQEHPFVQGFPLWMKEELRHKACCQTGHSPASVFLSMPEGPSRCVYDMNLAISLLFDDFTLYLVDYNSPTRIGKRAIDRPFIEIEIDGVLYLADTLLKCLYRSDMFKEKYGFDIKDKNAFHDFSKAQLKMYAKNTAMNLHGYADYLLLCDTMFETMKERPEIQEQRYEIDKSLEIFPEVLEEKKILQKRYEEFSSLNFPTNFKF